MREIIPPAKREADLDILADAVYILASSRRSERYGLLTCFVAAPQSLYSPLVALVMGMPGVIVHHPEHLPPPVRKKRQTSTADRASATIFNTVV